MMDAGLKHQIVFQNVLKIKIDRWNLTKMKLKTMRLLLTAFPAVFIKTKNQ